MNHRSSMNDVHTYIPMHEEHLYKSNASYVSVSHMYVLHICKPVHCVTGWHSKAANTQEQDLYTHALHGHTTDMQTTVAHQLSSLHQLCR